MSGGDIGGLTEIRALFDGVLIDQFGVLHDGQAPFPGAQDCLWHLREAGVPVVALSNSGKRSALNIARLERLGFPKRLFRHVITSGELAHARIDAWLRDAVLAPGTPVAVISRDDDASMIEGLDVVRVGLGDRPHLLIIAAVEPETRSLDSYLADLGPLAHAGIPALCINPDRRIYAAGRAAFGPGLLAERYRGMGASVEMLGKPGAEMFQAGLDALGGIAPERCLMIGDSPDHDIAGGRAAGCRTVLIATGVQAEGGPNNATADHTMASLAW